MASALSGESIREVRPTWKIFLLQAAAQLAKRLSIPQQKRDQARNMLGHGRSLEEVVAVTKLSMYTVRRLRQQVMAARIIKRNRKTAGDGSTSFQ